jgi:hypothetical protein
MVSLGKEKRFPKALSKKLAEHTPSSIHHSKKYNDLKIIK